VTNVVPTVPGAVIALVMMGATAAAATVIVSVALPVPAVFVAPSVAIEMPAVVGVPVMAAGRSVERSDQPGDRSW
jgi:hypothetical protein